MAKGRLIALACALVVGGGCHRHGAVPARDAGVSTAEGVDAGSIPAASSTSLPPITAHAVDAFVRFQKTALALTAEAKADAAQARADAGLEQRQKLYAALQRRAAEDARARAASGLSDAELERLERLTQAVLTKRAFARSFDYDGQIRSFSQLREKLPEASRGQVNETIKELERQRDETVGLSQERARYGSAAVDLVLAREADLDKIYQATLDVLGAGKRDGGR